jgi:V8-like Glu-specific endopeptidase
LVAAALVGCESGTSTTAPLARVDAPIASITHGDLDGSAHPGVVYISFHEVGTSNFFACSGTMLSATVVLTAGHCTGEPGEFDQYFVLVGSDLNAGYVAFHSSVHASHPDFTEAQFYLHDVGIVVLDNPVPTSLIPASAYGTLPSVGQLDALQPSVNTTFTAVGYGIQKITPSKVEISFARMFATPRLLNINDKKVGTFSLLLSNNAATGGTCFGDSGGPNFLGTSSTVAAVTSFALNGNCTSTGGGAFRLDKADVLSFINSYLP